MENTCARVSFLINFQEHLFYRTLPGKCFWKGCFWLFKCNDRSINWRYRDLPKSHDHGEIKFVDEIYPHFILADAEKCHLETWHLDPGKWNLTPGTWYLTPGTWHLEPDRWHVAPSTCVSILPFIKVTYFTFLRKTFPDQRKNFQP